MVDPFLFTPVEPCVTNGVCQSANVAAMKVCIAGETVTIPTAIYLFSQDTAFVYNGQTFDFRAGYGYALSDGLLSVLQGLGLVTAA